MEEEEKERWKWRIFVQAGGRKGSDNLQDESEEAKHTSRNREPADSGFSERRGEREVAEPCSPLLFQAVDGETRLPRFSEEDDDSACFHRALSRERAGQPPACCASEGREDGPDMAGRGLKLGLLEGFLVDRWLRWEARDCRSAAQYTRWSCWSGGGEGGSARISFHHVTASFLSFPRWSVCATSPKSKPRNQTLGSGGSSSHSKACVDKVVSSESHLLLPILGKRFSRPPSSDGAHRASRHSQRKGCTQGLPGEFQLIARLDLALGFSIVLHANDTAGPGRI